MRVLPSGRPGLTCAISLLLGLLAGTPQVTFAAPTAKAVTSLSQYRALLSDYNDAITNGSKVSPETAADLSERLSQATTVQRTPMDVMGGENIEVDNQTEIATLRHIAETPHGAESDQDAQDRVKLLVDLVAPGKNEVAIADPDRAAKLILSRAEFQYAAPKTLPEVKLTFLDRFFAGVARFFESIGDAFARFIKWLNNGRDYNAPNVSPLVGLAVFIKFFAFAVLVVAAIGGVGYFAIPWYLNGGRFRFRRRTVASSNVLDLGPDEIADPLGSARRLAEFGDYRGAIRLVYIASLRRLATAGLLVLEPNRTNWEYQSGLRARSSQVYAAMLPATRLFDRVWYGRIGSDASEFERLVAIYDQLPDAPSGVVGEPTASRSVSTAEADR